MSLEDSELFSISDQPDDPSVPHVPIYNVSHVIDIDGKASSENDDKPKRFKSGKNCCWNCGDTGHSLRQCPLPHNPREINKNRASFSTRVEFKRYHVDIKDESFNHLKPGVISDKLREALGLRQDQLPMHIYRMRSLGYPPGWLLEAKVDSSGIEMFDVDGNRVPNADEEEGEIGTAVSLYDESKIITFPGFNEWPHPGTLDETREYGAPDLSSLPSKEEFVQSLKHMNPAIPKPLKSNVELPNPSTCDMETEDIDEGQEKNTPWWTSECQVAIYNRKLALKTYKKNRTVDNHISFRKARAKARYVMKKAKEDYINSCSASLKNSSPPKIEKEINLLPEDSKCTFIPPMPEDSDAPPPPPEDPEEGEIMDVTSGEKSVDGSESFAASNEGTPDPNSEFADTSHGRVKSIELGTPALKIHSPFQRLPPPEAFRKDISDVINFENLPDSTGAYEKLKDVLKNVRSTLSVLKDVKMNNTI